MTRDFNTDEKRPFLEHLEELRRRIIFSIISVILLSVLSYTFAENIIAEFAEILERPLVFISPQEAFLTHLRVALFGGLFLSLPVILFNLLRFILIALNASERKTLISFLISGVFLFALGGIFAYRLVLPIAIKFLLGFSSDVIKPFISVSKYISFGVFLILAFCLAFETPLIIIFLARLGVVTSSMLRRKRRYFIVMLFVVAAILTPPDAITQVLLAAPLLALYEISIWFARIFEKKTYI